MRWGRASAAAYSILLTLNSIQSSSLWMSWACVGLYETPARQEINIWHLCCSRSLSTRRGSWWRFTGWMLELPSTRPSDLPTSPWQRVTIHKALCIFPWVTDCPLPHWWPQDSVSKCTDEQARLQSCLYGIAQWWVANGCCTSVCFWCLHKCTHHALCRFLKQSFLLVEFNIVLSYTPVEVLLI